MPTIKSQLRNVVIFTMIAATAAGAVSGSSGLDRWKDSGETMADQTVKGVEKRKDIFEEGAHALFREYMSKFPAVTWNDYYNYLKAYNIQSMPEFKKSLYNIRSNISNIRAWAQNKAKYEEGADKLFEGYGTKFPGISRDDYYNYLRIFNLTTPKEFQASLGRYENVATVKERVQREIAKQEGQVVAQQVSGMGVLGEYRRAEAAKATVVVPARAVAEEAAAPTTAIHKYARTVFEGNPANTTIEMVNEKEVKTRLYPKNINALRSVTTDIAALEKASDVEFSKELNEVSDLSVAGNKELAEHIINRISGCHLLYNAFVQAGVDRNKVDLEKYIKSGYAEYLGSALGMMNLSEQARFDDQIISFIASHIKKGKLDEIGEPGKAADYAIAAIGTAFGMQYMYEGTAGIRTENEARKKEITARMAQLDKQMEKAAPRERDALSVERAAVKADLDAVEETLAQLDRIGAKPKAISQFYEEFSVGDRMGMANLEKYIKNIRGMSMKTKAAFLKGIAKEGRQKVLMQEAIEASMGKIGAKDISDANKNVNVWRNYYRGVMGTLKELASANLSPLQRVVYGQVEATYRDRLDEIVTKMKPEEATKFIIDLIDPLNNKVKGQSYEDYLKKAIREKWEWLCLEDFKSGFKDRFYFGLAENIVSDVNIVSLVFDHHVTVEEMNYVLRNGGSINSVITKLENFNKYLNTEDYETIRNAFEGAADKLNIDKGFRNEFFRILASRLAIIDAVNPESAMNNVLGVDGVVFEGQVGEKAFSALMERLYNERIEVSGRKYAEIRTLSDEEVQIIRNLEMAERVNSYLKLYHNKYLKLEDRSNTMISSKVLKYFRNRVDVEKAYINKLGKSESYIAVDKELRDASNVSLDYTLSRINYFIRLVGNGTLNAEMQAKLSDGDKFLLDNVLNGRIIVAGPYGWNVSDDMSGVSNGKYIQGFTPVTYYFMNNASRLNDILNDDEAKFSTGGWEYITGKKKNKDFYNKAFGQAYAFYMAEYARNANYAYKGGALDMRIKSVFGENVLANLNSSVSLAADFFKYRNPTATAEDMDRLMLRLKLLYVSEIVVEAPFNDLCHDKPNRDEAGFDRNFMDRWVKGYKEASAGIQISDITIMNTLISNIADSKWAKGLRSGQYTIEFDDGEHVKRSFAVTVEAQIMGEARKTAVPNIKIEPVEPLQNLISSGLTLYSGDRMMMRSRETGEVALVSKSNTAIVMAISAKVGRAGYEKPEKAQDLLSNNFVPNGYHETGLIPTSFHGGYYRAFITPGTGIAVVDKTMAFVEKLAAFTPIYVEPTVKPFTETQVIPITTEQMALIIQRTTTGGMSPADVAALQGQARVVIRTDAYGNVQYTVNRIGPGNQIGVELNLENMTTLLNELFPDDPLRPGAAEQVRNGFLSAFYGLSADPTMRIGLSRNNNGDIVVATYDSQGNALQSAAVLIDNATISRILYGNIRDRFSAYLVQTARVKIGKKITLNTRLEEGTMPFTTRQRQYILNVLLSSNIPYTRWEKMLSSTNAVGVEAYVLGEVRDILSSNQRSFSAGAGGTVSLETERTATNLTAQALGRYIPGAVPGQRRFLTTNLLLTEQFYPSPTFGIYGTLGLNSNNPIDNLLGTAAVDRGVEQTAGLGINWDMTWNWRLGSGAELRRSGGINTYVGEVSLGYKNVLLELRGGAKEDPYYGPEMLFNRRAAFFGQVRLITNLGTLNKPKKKGRGK